MSHKERPVQAIIIILDFASLFRLKESFSWCWQEFTDTYWLFLSTVDGKEISTANQAQTVQKLLYFSTPMSKNRMLVSVQKKNLLPNVQEILLLASKLSKGKPN